VIPLGGAHGPSSAVLLFGYHAGRGREGAETVEVATAFSLIQLQYG